MRRKRNPFPEVAHILRQAGIDAFPNARARVAVLAAMRKAADGCLAEVTEQKRCRHYGHAAQLVAACVTCDRPPEVARWVASIGDEYRRFPALHAELNRHAGAS